MLCTDVLVQVRRTREVLAAVPAPDRTRGRAGTFVLRPQQIQGKNLPTDVAPKPAVHDSLVPLETYVTRKLLAAASTVVPYAAVRHLLVPTEVAAAAESFAACRTDKFRTAAVYRAVRTMHVTSIPSVAFYSRRSENAKCAKFRTADLLDYIFYVPRLL